MLVFILRRLAQAVVVMLTVAFIAFMLFQYVGDPVTNLLGQDATPEQRDAIARRPRARPAVPGAVRAPSSATRCRASSACSLRQGRKVSTLIVERFPATLELALEAAVLALAGRHSDGRVCRAEARQLPLAGC